MTGWWWLLALLALQLALGLTLGRRWCVACVLYFEVLQPRLGEGRLEDARPPRFANLVGFAVLTAASAAYAVGWTPVGAALGLLVATLALLAAATGFCAGCTAFRIGYRLTGRPFVSCPSRRPCPGLGPGLGLRPAPAATSDPRLTSHIIVAAIAAIPAAIAPPRTIASAPGGSTSLTPRG